MIAQCLSTVGEPRSEIPHALIFSRLQSCFIARKDIYIFCGILVVGY